jgi:aspartate/methionine/tyrosine aminotransferase
MLRSLPEFKLESYLGKWEFSAPYNLSASDVQTMRLADLLKLADDEDVAAWEELALGYTETLGSPRLRDVIAGTYRAISGADVMCFAGAQEGIFVAAQALLSTDDHAIVITPAYQALESIPAQLCATTGVALQAGNGWMLSLDDVLHALQANTRLIVLNFPNNPTGKVVDRSTFDTLIEIARARGIFIFSDEVYHGLESTTENALPHVADVYERGLSLGVMSKAYGFPGLRIGWVATRDHALIEKMNGLKHYLSICNAGPSELLAIIALKARERILAVNRALIATNLELCGAFFARHENLFDWYVPDAGCVAYPAYRGPADAETFCRTLLETAGVLLLPPSMFISAIGPSPVDRFRIGFGRTGLARALEQFDRYIERAR